MGDANHACRGFETPSLGSDLWPMGFDVDLALETPGTRKDAGSSLNSGLISAGLNSLHCASSSTGGGYNDINHLTGLSSILQRSDDLHPGDICQMTDLTNSLPKGDSESAQSLLAKLACHDLGPDLTASVDESHKEIETALFDQNPSALSHAGNAVSNVLSQKTLESADVYGRMTCYGGKLILQLRHFNLNTNYTMNVTECWLCGDKIGSGPELCSHKHSLNGLFQVNEEYVQLDIEHYIIPEHALDAPDAQDITDSMLQHPTTSGLHHMSTPRDLDIPENISAGGDTLGLDTGTGVDIGASSATLHYTTSDGGLMPPLSVAPNLMSHGMTSQNPCLNPSFEQLPLPSMTVTNASDMNSSIPSTCLGKNDGVTTATQALSSVDTTMIGCTSSTSVLGCSASTPVMGLTPPDTVPSTSLISTPIQKKLPLSNSQISLMNNYTVDNVLSNFDEQITSTPVPTQSVLREITADSKDEDELEYHLPFSDGEYTCHTTSGVSSVANKQTSDPCLTSLETVSLSLDSQVQRSDIIPRKQDVGSKKRKSKTRRKSGLFHDSSNRVDSLETSPSKHLANDPVDKSSNDTLKNSSLGSSSIEYRHMAKSDASFEDWFRQSLPEDDLIVNENHLKRSRDIESKLSATEADLESSQTRKEILNNSPRSREPDQTSRLAAHMLKKGLDLVCGVCQKDFVKDVKLYKIHMKEHGIKESELFPCCFCTKSFKMGKHYTQHLRTHIKNRRFSCRLCNASYTRESKLQRHMLNHSKDGPKKEFQCDKCSKSFATKYYLLSHLQSHDPKKFKCDTCGFLCSNQYNLDTHKKKHMKDKPYKCEHCEKTFLRRDFLDSHMESTHKNKKLVCEICNKLFSRKDVLKRHIASHNNETHECEVCNKKFSRKDRLVMHSRLHNSTSMLKCSLCPASFIRKSVFENHEKMHQTKEQCKICFKFLPTQQKLLSHMKLHSPEKEKKEDEGRHKCERCGKSLCSKREKRRHLRRVHGVVPEVTKKKMKLEMKPEVTKKKVKPEVKPELTKKKVNTEVTKKKVKAVEREKRFFCQLCSRGFTRSCNLKSHLLKAHRPNVVDDDEFEDDLSLVLKKAKLESGSITTKRSKLESRSNTTKPSSSISSSASSSTITCQSSSSMSLTCTPTTASSASGFSSFTSFPVVGPFTSNIPSPSPSSTPPHPTLSISSHFPSSGPPDSPVNLSTDAITAAAYLLAYLSYPGPY